MTNEKITKAVVLAAGRGTRMRELTADLPKPMIEVRRKPVLQHLVEGLRNAGIREFLIVIGYHANAVRNFFDDGSRYDIAIQYATQTVQDGTGRVVDLPDSVDAIITVKRGEDVTKGGAVFLNGRMELVDLREKAKPDDATSPWYNTGLYAFRPSIFEFTAKLKPSPRGEYELTDAIRDLAQSGNKVQALELTGEWADVRDPEILARLNQDP